MPYYRPCPVCGASLDPGERCDCLEKERAALVEQHQGGRINILSTDQIHLKYIKQSGWCQA